MTLLCMFLLPVVFVIATFYAGPAVRDLKNLKLARAGSYLGGSFFTTVMAWFLITPTFGFGVGVATFFGFLAGFPFMVIRKTDWWLRNVTAPFSRFIGEERVGS